MSYCPRAPSTTTPGPLGWVAVTAIAPLVAWLLATQLLVAINIDGQQAASYPGATHKAVRTAIQQTLTRELHADRIQQVLLATEAPPAKPTAKPDEAAAARRKAERTEQIKPAATRLAGDVASLTDALVLLAVATHPSTDPRMRPGGPAAPAGQPQPTVETVLDARLEDAAVAKEVANWAGIALDAHSRQQVARALPAGVTVERVISDAVSPARLRADVRRAVTPALTSFDVRTGSATWSADVNGRLAWAMVTLVFCLTWAVVVLYAGMQIATLDSPHRWIVAVAATLAAGVGGAVVESTASSTTVPAPLLSGLVEYGGIYGVRMLEWASGLSVLTAIGATALIAGSIATLCVHIASKEELDEQLVGLKSLFNAGSLLLLAGVLEVYALLRWPLVFIADEASRTAMQSAAATYGASIGALFSVMLLVTYIPATIALRRQALAKEIPAKDVAESMSAAGFGDLTSQQLLRLTQALLPLLPGVISIVG